MCGRLLPLRRSRNTRNTHYTTASITGRLTSRFSTTAAARICRLRSLRFFATISRRIRNSLIKFVFMHRPSWIVQVVLANPEFPLHQLAKRYGAKYVIAGHIHQMLHFELEDVMYLSMASSGGHLRGTKEYKNGWFFQHTIVTVRDAAADFEIKEVGPPFGQSRVSKPTDWGPAGLNEARPPSGLSTPYRRPGISQ